MKTTDEWEEFDKAFSDVIPKGKWGQYSMAKGAKASQHDTSHDMSAIHNGKWSRIGTFKHNYYAGYVETIINAYHNGDLVPACTIGKEVKE